MSRRRSIICGPSLSHLSTGRLTTPLTLWLLWRSSADFLRTPVIVWLGQPSSTLDQRSYVNTYVLIFALPFPLLSPCLSKDLLGIPITLPNGTYACRPKFVG